MSNIREFRVVQEKSNNGKEFSDKIKKHRLTGFFTKLGIVIFILLVIGLIFFQYKNQTFTSAVIVSQIDRNNVEGTSFLENDGNIITYSKDGISSTDAKGKALWNMTYEMQNPIVRKSTGIVAVGDYNGHIIYLIDGKGTTSEIDTNLPIRNFTVSSAGVVATVLEDNHNSWVTVYNREGTKIAEAKATMSKTGYPMAVTLSGEVMGVSYFYVDSDTMKSSVTYYNFGGVGENTADHIVSSYDYADAVVPVLEFLDDQTSFAVADSRIMFFSGSKKPTGVADVLLNEEIQGVYYGDTYAGLLFYDATGTAKYRLDIYSSDGKKQLSYFFDMDFKDILIRNDEIVIYNEGQCIVIGMNGREKYTGSFSSNVLYIAPTNSPKKFILVKEDTLETIELK